jgi:predicted nuclease with TOPRIM domain
MTESQHKEAASAKSGKRVTKKDLEAELAQTREELERVGEERNRLNEQLEQAKQTMTQLASRARQAEAFELQVRRTNDELRSAFTASQARVRELLAESQGG